MELEKSISIFLDWKRKQGIFFFSSDGCYKNTLSLVNGEMWGEDLDL